MCDTGNTLSSTPHRSCGVCINVPARSAGGWGSEGAWCWVPSPALEQKLSPVFAVGCACRFSAGSAHTRCWCCPEPQGGGCRKALGPFQGGSSPNLWAGASFLLTDRPSGCCVWELWLACSVRSLPLIPQLFYKRGVPFKTGTSFCRKKSHRRR